MDGFQFGLIVVLLVGLAVAVVICFPVLSWFFAIAYGLLTGV